MAAEGSRLTLSPERYHRITLLCLFALSFIIITGASVRLTGSGLGCSDWPTCEEDQFVAELDNVHAMVEFVNRLITGIVSLAVIAAVLGSMFRQPRRRDLTLWSWGLVAGVLAQILLGALVVREHLPPELVSAHFLVSMVLVWNAMVLHNKAARPDHTATTPTRVLPQLQRQVRFISGLAMVALVTGTTVTGSGPHSGDEKAERLPFAVEFVARIHSASVILTIAAIVWFAIVVGRPGGPPDLRRAVQTVLVVAVAQAGVGWLQYFTDVPVLLVGIHVLGATTLWIAIVSLHLRVQHPVANLLDGPAATEPVTESGLVRA